MSFFSPAFDAELAARLNELPVPGDLLNRLRSIPLASDADLDAELTQVIIPPGLSGRLLATTRHDRRWPALLRQAVAAVVVFTVSLAYAASVVAFVNARFEPLASADESRHALAAQLDRAEPLVEQASADIESPLIELDSLTSAEAAPLNTLPAMEFNFLAAFSSSVPRWSQGECDRLPIERPAIRLPDNAAFDDRFWRQTGMLPWLQADGEPNVEVPPVTDCAGYRLFRSELAAGRLLPESAIRVEDFLAGVDYGLANSTIVEPRILLSAAPSPFFGRQADAGDTDNRWLVMLSVDLPGEPAAAGKSAAGSQRQARLDIQFARNAVAAYRVIGYVPPHSGGSVSPSWDDDEGGRLSVPTGKSAVVLCEIQTATDELKGELIRVSLQTDDNFKATAALTAGSLAADADAAPIAWQQAALVALAAEHLAGSPFTEGMSLANIAARARQIEHLVYDRAGWREFIETLVTAQSAKSSLLRAF